MMVFARAPHLLLLVSFSVYYSLCCCPPVVAWNPPTGKRIRALSTILALTADSQEQLHANDANGDITQRTIDMSVRLGLPATTRETYSLSNWNKRWFAVARWMRRRVLLPLLHCLDKIPNKHINLEVLWWKAMTERGRQHDSTTISGGTVALEEPPSWAFEMLPPVVRSWLFLLPFMSRRRACRAIELRTAYIDSIILLHSPNTAISQYPPNVRLISLGAGYDTRSLRMNRHLMMVAKSGRRDDASSHKEEAALYFKGFDHTIELDLAPVVKAKHWLLQERVLKRQKSKAATTELLEQALESIDLVPTELNEDVRSGRLKQVLLERLGRDGVYNISDASSSTTTTPPSTTTCHVIVLEAILMYLDDGIPAQLLQTISQVLHELGYNQAILIFADSMRRLNLTNDTATNSNTIQTHSTNVVQHENNETVRRELELCGWKLGEFCRVRGFDLGWASLIQSP